MHAFRGIPYARPPVGALRWRPPEAPEPWTGVRSAARSGPAAPQNAGRVATLVGSAQVEWDEDCLTLHVWTPAPDAGRRPVVVWIHGGGFTTGAASMPIYDGTRLARRGDVVVVGVNYRLGALGYLALPCLAEGGDVAGNYGLLDQIAALRWVREHAHVFGASTPTSSAAIPIASPSWASRPVP